MRTGGKCDALARARGGEGRGPMFLGMGSSFYEIWVSNSVVITEFFFFGHYTLVCDGFVSKNVHKKGRYFNVKIPLKYFAY